MELGRETFSGIWAIKAISCWLEERIRRTGFTRSTAHRSQPRIQRDNSDWQFLTMETTGSFRQGVSRNFLQHGAGFQYR